jgi:light-regulated signal transduction histidine kinase (bacteriophytochrome)
LSGWAADVSCSYEPIHIPGTIQPYGALLVVDPALRWTIVAASRNASAVLFETPWLKAIIGTSIAQVLGTVFAKALLHRFHEERLGGEAPWQSTLTLPDQPFSLDASSHSHAGLVLVELERSRPADQTEAMTAGRLLQEAIVELRGTRNSLEALGRVAARHVRLITGYERVVIYKFDAEWNGQAIAELKNDDWSQSLDGLHFPASDIPAQARALYQRSPMRFVPDRDATPMPLDADPVWMSARATPQAVDLSFARLRSLSPIHMQYHRNMGVNGSISMSILHEQTLWGLVICHHRRPHHPSPGQRTAAAALTDVFALRVGSNERAATDQARRRELALLSALLIHMADAEDVTAALTEGETTIGNLFSSTGAAVLYDGTVALIGQTPPETDILELVAWLRTQNTADKLFQTNALSAAFPAWTRYTAIASGVLAVFLAADRSDVLLWFRQEPQIVNWGGSPHADASESGSILPRLSFERWVETRHGVATPWDDWELEIADSLRHGIMEVVIRGLRKVADLNDRLRQSQKMEAVGQLTGGLAHDFNNLLTGIIGSLELIGHRLGQGRLADLDRYIGAAMTSANRAASLTHRLLAFSRRQTLDPRPLDVNRLISSMEDLIRRTTGPGIHVETVASGGLWRTLCDANQLENALLNLAINARDAMPEGGRLTIEATNARLDDDYADLHPDVIAGQYVAISVTDTGSGMAAEVKARAFDPFFTTKPLGQGTGLGLSMVYGFAKQSNGYTTIYSEIGQGTSVRLYLPRYLGKDDAAAAALPVLLPSSQGSEIVLVVDDEPVVRMLIGDVLRDLGYAVIEAADGAEGLRVLDSPQPVDLLISDVGLPGGLNGRQLADAARVGRPDLKVLFITGYAENAVLSDGMLAPAMQVMTKPFALDALAAKIRSMM